MRLTCILPGAEVVLITSAKVSGKCLTVFSICVISITGYTALIIHINNDSVIPSSRMLE